MRSPHFAQNFKCICMLVLLGAASSYAENVPDKPPEKAKTGDSNFTFTERSPFSSGKEIAARFKSGPPPEYDLSKESYTVFVPAIYDPAKPIGLMVFISSSPQGWVPYKQTCEQHYCIWVSANKSGNDRPPPIRWGLALDAVFNLKKLYAIDDDRVYLSGISGGGRAASMAAMQFPEVFQGALYSCGQNFYKDVPMPSKPGYFWPSAMPAPKTAFLEPTKAENRFVFHTNEKDFNREETHEIEALYRKEGFKHTLLIEEPGKGHELYSAETLSKALDFLDAPLLEKARDSYAQGVRAEAAGHLGEALDAYGKALGRGSGLDFAKDADERLKALGLKRDSALVTAQKDFEARHFEDAAKRLQELAANFGDKTPPAAQALLSKLNSDPTIQAALKQNEARLAQARRETEAQATYDAARALAQKEVAKGYEALNAAAQKFADTAAGKVAAAEAEKISHDPVQSKALRSASDSKAAGVLLRTAKNLMQNNLTDQAREKLQEIVKDYSSAPEADTARELLKQLK